MRETDAPAGSDDALDGMLAEIRSRMHPLDPLLVLAVPAVLVYVFWLPDPVRDGLVFSHAEPTIRTAYTAHFVHRSFDHLAANLAVYVVVVVPAYLLCLLADRRSDFLVAFTVFVGAFPFVLSGLALLFVDRGVVFGFSGVAMAFIGFLPVALFAFLGARVDDAFHLDRSPAVFFLGAAVISLRSVPGIGIGRGVAAVAALVGAIYAASIARGLWYSDGGVRRNLLRPGALELVGSGGVAFFAALVLAFPADPIDGGTVVDLNGHLLGYSLGYIASYVTIRLEDYLRGPPVPSPPDA